MPDVIPNPTPTPAPPKTIGEQIGKVVAAKTTSEASKAAALAADKQATDDQAYYEAEQSALAAALKFTGPITEPNGDGTFSTFEVSTTSPFFTIEISKGADTLIEPPAEPTP